MNAVKETNFVRWFGRRPVISFTSDDIFLVSGSPEIRRKFIDLLCSQIDHEYLKLLFEYKHWLRCRNSLLQSNFHPYQCDIYDEKLSIIGSEIIEKRFLFIDTVKDDFKRVYKELSRQSDNVTIEYNSTINSRCSSKKVGKNVFYTRLLENREKDKNCGYTSYGPHRDTLAFYFNEKDARIFCSQGQCRSLALSLKIACGILLENFIQEKIIYLVDDAVSELDSHRTEQFFSMIDKRGQIFIAMPLGKTMFGNSFQTIHLM